MKTDKARVIYAREDSTLDVTDVYRQNDMMLNTLFVRLNDHVIAVEQLEQDVKDYCDEIIELNTEVEKLEQKLAAAEAKIKALEWVAKDNSLRTYDGLTEKIAEQEMEIKKLREGLIAYGTHHNHCSYGHDSFCNCTCGLEQLTKEK